MSRSIENTMATHGQDPQVTQLSVEHVTTSQASPEQHRTEENVGVANNTLQDKQELMQTRVKAWRKENIYKTKGVTATQEKILSQDCVCVVGVPGAGKSTAIHHAALNLENKGYIVYCVHAPKDLLEYFDRHKKQVFILDDVLGIHLLDHSNVESWDETNDEIRRVLSTNTKLLVSIRTQLYNLAVKGNDFVFLDKSTCIDFSDKTYILNMADMKGMLIHYLTINGVDNIDDLMRMIYFPGRTEKQVQDMTEKDRQSIMSMGFTEFSEFFHCFPLLCKVFCSEESVRRSPWEFFTSPFQAITVIFQNIKSYDNLQFCGLVLCAVFDGKLTEDLFRSNCKFGVGIEEQSVALRNVILASCNLEDEKYLPQIKSALDSLDGVYVTRVGKTYEMTHTVFHDVVTYLFNATQPLFVLKYGKSKLIYDRIRLRKTQLMDDPYMIIIDDDKNIERLADRLVRDLQVDAQIGAKLIAYNPNIGDDRLFSALKSKLYNIGRTDKNIIDELFIRCMESVEYTSKINEHDDLVQYKLIEFCVHTGVDCNMYFKSAWYPLSFAVDAGSLQLTQLFLNNGADKRRLLGGQSILHLCCEIKYNKLGIIKLLTQHGEDQSVVEFITSDRDDILQAVEDYNYMNSFVKRELEDDLERRRTYLALVSKNLQLEEFSSDNSIKLLTTDKKEVKHFVEHCLGKIQLVRRIHDNILTYVNMAGRNILHLSVDDYGVTEYLLSYPCLQLEVNTLDSQDRNSYWYVVNNKKPDLYVPWHMEDVTVEDKEAIVEFYRKHGAVLYDSSDEEKIEVIYDQKQKRTVIN